MDTNLIELSHLTADEKMLVANEVSKNKKDKLTAWLLWWFLGGFGGHRYYFNKTGSAIAMTILTITVVGVVITGPWVLIDAFSVNKWLRENEEQTERDAILRVKSLKN